MRTLLNKLQLNVLDKSIIKFVENLDFLNPEETKIIENLNQNLIYIKSIKGSRYTGKMSKRNLKLIIGISGYHKEFFKDNTLSKITFLFDFSNKLSAFNSSESDENSFSKYYGDEFAKDKKYFIEHSAPTYRCIYNSFTKSTSPLEFKKQMNNLHKICNLSCN